MYACALDSPNGGKGRTVFTGALLQVSSRPDLPSMDFETIVRKVMTLAVSNATTVLLYSTVAVCTDKYSIIYCTVCKQMPYGESSSHWIKRTLCIELYNTINRRVC